MCGIVGIISHEDVAGRLLDGLKRLEYRGYDSAGIATVDRDRIERRRAPGKLSNLAKALEAEPLSGAVGRSEEHTSELQSLMRNWSVVFCFKKKQSTRTVNTAYQTRIPPTSH